MAFPLNTQSTQSERDYMHVDADKLEKKKYSTNTSVQYKIN